MSQSESTALVTSASPRASDQLATFLGIEKGMMLDTLKAQCFKGKRPDEVTDAQLAAFVSTANVLQVNPLLPGMLYAFPERNGGITPILGPDGVFKKLAELISANTIEGVECDVECDKEGKPLLATATIHRPNGKPAKYTAYFSEWVVPNNPNWQTRPRHMLWIRAIKQCARQVIHGLPMDADEYAISQMTDVTPEPVAERPAAPKREAKGAAKVKENAAKATEVVTEVVVEKPADKPATPAPTPEPEKPAESARTEKPAPEAAPAVAAAPAPEAPKPPLAPVLPKPPEQPTMRAFLKDGEQITAVCRIKEVVGISIGMSGKHHASARATLTGGFNGVVRHIGGGTFDAADNVTLNAPWEVGAEVEVTLTGRANKAQAGQVNVFVDAIKVATPPEEF